jgi:hypothetical protein
MLLPSYSRPVSGGCRGRLDSRDRVPLHRAILASDAGTRRVADGHTVRKMRDEPPVTPSGNGNVLACAGAATASCLPDTNRGQKEPKRKRR